MSPLFKSGDKDDSNNYRPICMVSVLLQIFEQFVNNQLVSYLDKTKSSSAVVDLVSEIQLKIDQKQKCALVSNQINSNKHLF